MTCHTLMVLSHPEDAKRFSTGPGPLAATSEPGGGAGDHDTAVAPGGCALSTCLHNA